MTLIAKVTVQTKQNLFPGHNLSQVTFMGMILHIIVVHDSRVVTAGLFVLLRQV